MDIKLEAIAKKYATHLYHQYESISELILKYDMVFSSEDINRLSKAEAKYFSYFPEELKEENGRLMVDTQHDWLYSQPIQWRLNSGIEDAKREVDNIYSEYWKRLHLYLQQAWLNLYSESPFKAYKAFTLNINCVLENISGDE